MMSSNPQPTSEREWGKVTRPLKAGDSPPRPWPPGHDPGAIDQHHSVRLTVEDGSLSMKVLCPFDETDTERPCWPREEVDGVPLPGPKQECVYIGWCENLAPDEFAAGVVSFDCAVRWDWSDGDGPTAELHDRASVPVQEESER